MMGLGTADWLSRVMRVTDYRSGDISIERVPVQTLLCGAARFTTRCMLGLGKAVAMNMTVAGDDKAQIDA